MIVLNKWNISSKINHIIMWTYIKKKILYKLCTWDSKFMLHKQDSFYDQLLNVKVLLIRGISKTFDYESPIRRYASSLHNTRQHDGLIIINYN